MNLLHSEKNVTPTNEMGILQEKVKGFESLTQYHNRGIDMFVRDLNRKRNPSADLYYDDLDTHNLVFGAGISGTTGTLLQAAYAFGGIVNGELLKQYTLAIIIYLIGGGMHSYHEVLSIAKKVGLYYSPGSFHWLPLSFKLNNEYGKWKEKYYDIVKMGATHWRFNQGVPPSHLNKNLRS
ncbi:cytotoxin Mcf [Escherichia coli]|nr:cytotoxin Mcf [Escherichia coli]EKO4061888.1 cytotoxin Mcf [Escherichia coli]EKO4245212.1 cytotoxin Mcf [Escherichia coli]EKR0375648.1 cytotoxin Mcf [Escherichia coli]EME9878445.1 cytotoxin Mcf [Escherichia coli]